MSSFSQFAISLSLSLIDKHRTHYAFNIVILTTDKLSLQNNKHRTHYASNTACYSYKIKNILKLEFNTLFSQFANSFLKITSTEHVMRSILSFSQNFQYRI
jgi:hypothetical protein